MGTTRGHDSLDARQPDSNRSTYPSTATNSFTYNGLDTRVGKVDSAGTSTYKRGIRTGVTAPVLSDGTIAYTPGSSERKSGSTSFDHANYLGTFTRQTNSSQSTTATRVYDAFGNLESATGTPQSPFGFVGGQGYQEDGDSGLKLLGHRYYDPSTGRFLTRDPATEGRNWYVYCASSPVDASDPDGLGWEWVKVGGKWVWQRVVTATAIASAVLFWAVWELAGHAPGNHRPPGWTPPTQPGIHPPHGLPGVKPPHTDPDGYWNKRKHMYDDDNNPDN